MADLPDADQVLARIEARARSLRAGRRVRRASAVAALALAGAVVLTVQTRSDPNRLSAASQPTTITSSTVVSGAGGCAITKAPPGVSFSPNRDAGRYEADLAGGLHATIHIPTRQVMDFVGEHTESITLANGRGALVWYSGEAAVMGNGVEVRADDGDADDPCGDFEVAVRGGSQDANRAAAIALAEGMSTGPNPDGAPRGDLVCPLPPDRPELLIRSPGYATAQLEGMRVAIRAPAIVRVGSDPSEPITVGGLPARLLTADREVVVSVTVGIGSCDSFEVNAYQGQPSAERTLALQLASEMIEALRARSATTTTTVGG